MQVVNKLKENNVSPYVTYFAAPEYRVRRTRLLADPCPSRSKVIELFQILYGNPVLLGKRNRSLRRTADTE